MDEDYEQFNEESEVYDEDEDVGPEGAFMRGYKEAENTEEDEEED